MSIATRPTSAAPACCLIDRLERRYVLSGAFGEAGVGVAAETIASPSPSAIEQPMRAGGGGGVVVEPSTAASKAADRARAKDAKAAKAAKAAKERKAAKAAKAEREQPRPTADADADADSSDGPFAAAQSAAPTSLDWRGLPGVSSVRDEAGGEIVNGKLYVFGGYSDHTWTASARVDVFDPDTNTWTRLRDMPEPLNHVATVVQGDLVWMLGGYRGDNPGPAVRSVYLYDTRTDTYTPGQRLPEPRGAGAAAIVGDKLVYFGGTDRDEQNPHGDEKGTTWVLDLDEPDEGWTRKRKMPGNRNHLAGVSLDGNVYAIGGQHNDQADARMLSEVNRYNPKLDRWSTVASLPVDLSHILDSTFVHDGRIVIVGGESVHAESRRELYAYDPADDLWTTMAYLPVGRRAAVVGVIDDQLFVSTGAYSEGKQNGDTIVATLPSF